MLLKSTNTNVEVCVVVETILTEAMLTYVERVVNLNTGTEERITSFLKDITIELTLMCSIRNFTILNTNVVKECQDRILENDTLRAFYFEMFRACVYRLELDYCMEDRVNIFDSIFNSALIAPCSVQIGQHNYLIRQDQSFKNLCGSVYVNRDVITGFLKANPWYIMVVLTNISAPRLLENIKIFSSAK